MSVLCSTLLYTMGQYFLDTQYNQPIFCSDIVANAWEPRVRLPFTQNIFRRPIPETSWFFQIYVLGSPMKNWILPLIRLRNHHGWLKHFWWFIYSLCIVLCRQNMYQCVQVNGCGCEADSSPPPSQSTWSSTTLSTQTEPVYTKPALYGPNEVN